MIQTKDKIFLFKVRTKTKTSFLFVLQKPGFLILVFRVVWPGPGLVAALEGLLDPENGSFEEVVMVFQDWLFDLGLTGALKIVFFLVKDAPVHGFFFFGFGNDFGEEFLDILFRYFFLRWAAFKFYIEFQNDFSTFITH